MTAPVEVSEQGKRMIGAMLGAVRWLTETMPAPHGTNVQAVTVPATFFLGYRNAFSPRLFTTTVEGSTVGMLETPFKGVFLAQGQDAVDQDATGRICFQLSDDDFTVLAVQERIWSMRAALEGLYDFDTIMGIQA